MVEEMEQRAEERKKIWEERRELRRIKDEERAAAQREAEEAKRQAEEELVRQRQLERQELERQEQRRKQEQLEAVSRQRERHRRANDLWVLHRLVRVWCALRMAVVEAEERNIRAWSLRRRALLRFSLLTWRLQFLWLRAGRQAASLGRALWATCHSRRHALRLLLSVLAALVRQGHAFHAAAQKTLLRASGRRRMLLWHLSAKAAAYDRRCVAARHYAESLRRAALCCWRLGAEESRCERHLELHRRGLHEKVAAWLKEMDAASDIK